MADIIHLGAARPGTTESLLEMVHQAVAQIEESGDRNIALCIVTSEDIGNEIHVRRHYWWRVNGNGFLHRDHLIAELQRAWSLLIEDSIEDAEEVVDDG